MGVSTLIDMRDVLNSDVTKTRIMKVTDVRDGTVTATSGKQTAFFDTSLNILASDNVIVDEGGIVGIAGRNLPIIFV